MNDCSPFLGHRDYVQQPEQCSPTAPAPKQHTHTQFTEISEPKENRFKGKCNFDCEILYHQKLTTSYIVIVPKNDGLCVCVCVDAEMKIGFNDEECEMRPKRSKCRRALVFIKLRLIPSWH